MKKLYLILSFIIVFLVPAGAQNREIPANGGQGTVVRFYPNPATTTIYFELQKVQPGITLEVYNLLGRKMLEQQNLVERTTVNLTDFTRGVYVYRLRDKSGRIIESGKFQVTK